MEMVVCVERLNDFLGVVGDCKWKGLFDYLMMAKLIILSTILHPIVFLLIASF